MARKSRAARVREFNQRWQAARAEQPVASKRVAPALIKPVLNDAVMKFAEGGRSRGDKAGKVPVGDVRLTVNMRRDLHLKLKIRAAEERTTIGELVERWVEGWKH